MLAGPGESGRCSCRLGVWGPIAVGAFLAVLSGCRSEKLIGEWIDNDSDTGAGNPDLAGCVHMDILFILDISESMAEEEQNLRNHFPTFIDVLDNHVANHETFESYRIGITNSTINGYYEENGGCTADEGMDGVLHPGINDENGDCGLGPNPWVDGPNIGIAEKFICTATDPQPPGSTEDCGVEKPLEAIEKFAAQLVSGGANEGFYRKDDESLLIIIVITDEDEDSDFSPYASDTSPIKGILDALTGGEDQYAVLVIAGMEDCESDFGEAEHAEVLLDFVGRIPNGRFGNICEADLATPLQSALDQWVAHCADLSK